MMDVYATSKISAFCHEAPPLTYYYSSDPQQLPNIQQPPAKDKSPLHHPVVSSPALLDIRQPANHFYSADISSKIIISDIFNSMSLSNCCHALQQPEHKSCSLCGCYLHPQGNVRGLKTQRYVDSDLIDSPTFFQSLKQRAQNFMTMEPIKLNPLVIQVLEETVAKFKLSLMTFCRAVYLFHQLLREKPQCQYQQLRYGTVCLYLTAKTTQCLSRIPNLQQFAKQAFRVFSQSEYDSLEEEVFNFALQKTLHVGLFTEFLEYYQVKGVLMSNERCCEDVKQLEDRIYSLSTSYIKTGQFLNFVPEKLAACILHQSRQAAKVSQVWNQHIESYTRLGTLQIFNIMKECRKRIISDVTTPSKRILVKPVNVSSVPSGTRHIRLAATSGTLSRSSSASNSHFLQPLRGISVIV